MKITKFHTGIALTTSLLLAALTGCGAANTASSSASSSTSTSVSASSNSAKKHTSFFVKDNGDGTKVIKDIDGKEVTVPTNPERIADLWHANNQVVLLLGGAEKLVSTTTNVKSLAWFKQVYPGIEKVDAPVKGTDVNMEQLLADKPEVLLASSKDQISKAAEAGIPAVHVEFQNFADLKRTVELTAEVIGTDAASLDKAAESCELFANLTPLGMKGFDKKHDYLGFIDRMPKTATVFDCIINPPLSETITAARAAGLNTVPGMRMLVAQMDVIFKFLFNQTVTGADKQACIEELCNYLGVPSNF